MGHYISLSCTPAFKKRVDAHFNTGEFSRWAVKILSDELDREEGLDIIRKHKESWMQDKVKPFLRDYSGSNDPYLLLDNPRVKIELKKAGIELSDQDYQTCITELIKEYDKIAR